METEEIMRKLKSDAEIRKNHENLYVCKKVNFLFSVFSTLIERKLKQSEIKNILKYGAGELVQIFLIYYKEMGGNDDVGALMPDKRGVLTLLLKDFKDIGKIDFNVSIVRGKLKLN